jgi:hypothetical protein
MTGVAALIAFAFAQGWVFEKFPALFSIASLRHFFSN